MKYRPNYYMGLLHYFHESMDISLFNLYNNYDWITNEAILLINKTNIQSLRQ